MQPGVETCVARALERIGRGGVATTTWLQREFDDRWQEVADALRLDDALAGDAPDVGIVGGYELETWIGRGGMGAVWRARPVGGGDAVAVKILRALAAASPSARAAFAREAALAASIRDANLVRVVASGEVNRGASGVPFVVMELAPGRPLREVLEERGALPAEECLRIALGVATALAAIHAAGAVHRDVKPENVIVDDAGRARLTDLGIASVAGDDAAPGFAGTARYAAPEQFRGAACDARTDLYALGVMLLECATGVHPADGPPSRPRGFVGALARALVRPEPSDRPRTAGDVVAAIGAGRIIAPRRRSGAARAGDTPALPIRGRERELRRMRAAWARARRGAGRGVVLHGDGGAGKSRLAEECAAIARRDGAHVVRARCGVGAELLRGLVDRGASRRRCRLDAALVRETALRRAARGACLVIVEDLHDARPDELRAVVALAGTAPQARILVVVTTRPCRAAACELGGLPIVEVGRLPATACAAIAADVLGLHSEEDPVAVEIAGRADGSALAARILALHARANVIVLPTGAARWRGAAVSLPAAVSDSVRARICALPAPARSLLGIAALIGDTFTVREVAAAAGTRDRDARATLSALGRAGGLVASDGRRFEHDLVRDAIAGAMEPEERRAAHRVLAAALGGPYGGRRLTARALRALVHWLRSGDPAAMSSAPRAIGAAARARRHDDVMRLADALSAVTAPGVAVLAAAADAAVASRAHDADARTSHALAAARTHGDAERVRHVALTRALWLIDARRLHDVRSIADDLPAPGADDPRAACVHAALASSRGNGDDAEAILRRALPRARGTMRARVQLALARVMMDAGRLAQADEVRRIALRGAIRGRDVALELTALELAIPIAGYSGRSASDVRERIGVYRERAIASGDALGVACSGVHLGTAMHLGGARSEAVAILRDAESALGRLGAESMAATAARQLAFALLELDRYSDAESAIARALEWLERTGVPPTSILPLRVQFLITVGAFDEADEILTPQMIERAASSGAYPRWLWTDMRVRLLTRMRREAEARALAVELESAAAALDSPLVAEGTAETIAALAAQFGDGEAFVARMRSVVRGSSAPCHPAERAVRLAYLARTEPTFAGELLAMWDGVRAGAGPRKRLAVGLVLHDLTGEARHMQDAHAAAKTMLAFTPERYRATLIASSSEIRRALSSDRTASGTCAPGELESVV